MRFSYKSIICLQLLVSSLYWSEGCSDEERKLLLQIKDSTGDRKHIYPLFVWVGENCCEWPGVLCQTSSHSSSHVVSIHLTWNKEGMGTWYPNASLFAQFKQLESLSMNQIGGWWFEPQGSCGRRNLKRLDLSGNNLDDEQIPICLLTNSSKLEELYLERNNLRSSDDKITRLGPSDEYMRSGSLSNYGFANFTFPGFVQIKNLRTLSLLINRLNESINSLSGLCGMGNLKKLDLSFNNLDDQHIPSCLLTNSSKLEELNLDGNNLQSLNGFVQIKSLRALYIWGNRLNESINSLSGLCGMGNLRSLDLSYNNLNDEEIPSCLLTNSSKLEELNLDENNLRSLDGLCGMGNLRSLELRYNNLDDEHIPSCLLTNSSKLEELYLDYNNFRSLDGLIHMKSLRVLSLLVNRLNESIDSLSGLCRMKILKKLDISFNNLDNGDIPPCFFANSSKLQVLYSRGNNLRRLEDFQKLSSLQELDLSENQLIDIGSWLSNLTSLISLSLYSNDLKDFETLKGLCSLRNLRDVYLYENSIEGQIPTCFKDVHSLRSFDLSSNQLSGSIPPSIFNNLTMIETFDIGNNQLNGVILFVMFANLSKLSSIDLSNNPQAKVETEHPHWTPTFQLLSLSLTRCNVSSNIPSFLSSQRHLWYFESDYSYLNGPIPPWILYNVTTPLLLSLRDNMLDGPLPESSQENPSMLTKLDISNNRIHSTLPINLGKLLPMLVHFNASGNALQGKIPPSVGELKILATLDLSKNNLSGEMQLSLAKNNPSLRCLVLSDNHFEGQIFARDFNASKLLIVILNNNHFTGIISQSLLNSHDLMFLDARNNKLVGTIPSWLWSLHHLVSVLLSGNNFIGHIPLDFCQMKNLHMLDLSNNSLSGSLPSCLNNITSLLESTPLLEYLSEITSEMIPMSSTVLFPDNIRLTVDFTSKGIKLAYEGMPLSLMMGLDFSMNRLTGDIPPQLGELKELHTLNLSNNLLMGSIPDSFKHLANIESLDLSHNKLIGPIPSQLVQLNYLSTFWVAFNNLSGKIPTGRQFDTFNASSYVGNLGLCGLPTKKNCTLDHPSQPSNEEEDNEEIDILSKPIIFYLWVVFSFALGFSSFALVLIFNANWRWNYFKVVDEFIDWTTRKFVLMMRGL